jgi:probable HAF family extracellular repeat protein
LLLEDKNVDDLVFPGTGVIPGTFIPLGVLADPYNEESHATGLSDDGYFVVGYSKGISEAQAFKWDAKSGMIGLDFISGISIKNNKAYGIDSDGKTKGWLVRLP